MTIREIVEEGFHYALTCRSLWLFGFFVGLWSGGSGGGPGGGGNSAAGAAAAAVPGVRHVLPVGSPSEVPLTTVAVVSVIAVLVLLLVLLRLIGEGALIEGVTRRRRGSAMSTAEGWRAGWAHWGVILRIALVYFGMTAMSVAVGVVPVVLAGRALGLLGGALVAVPVLVLLVPWLVTLYLVQAFATRIAVLEDRRALDAIARARLFLHQRIPLGLRLLVAVLAGSVIFAVVSAVILLPLVLLLIASLRVLPVQATIGLGIVIGLPLVCLLTALLGTYRSSIWTMGYLSQVDA